MYIDAHRVYRIIFPLVDSLNRHTQTPVEGSVVEKYNTVIDGQLLCIYSECKFLLELSLNGNVQSSSLSLSLSLSLSQFS